MLQNHAYDIVAALERQILSSLCAGTGAPDDWNRLASGLSDHRWRDPDHKVVYEALRAIKSCEPKTRRDELPAQVTRMGFPDLDCSLYFDGEEVSPAEIEKSIGRLKAATFDQS